MLLFCVCESASLLAAGAMLGDFGCMTETGSGAFGCNGDFTALPFNCSLKGAETGAGADGGAVSSPSYLAEHSLASA